MKDTPKPKTYVIGLDGATFDVLAPLAEEGVIPVIANLMNAGVSCPMRTTFPPSTAVAWVAMAASVNPGKFGAYSHRNIKNGDLTRKEPVTSAVHRSLDTLWRVLNDNGLSAGLFNFPELYPAYPINGFMVSGVGAPMTERSCYPDGFLAGLNAAIGREYRVAAPINHPRYRGDIPGLHALLTDLADMRSKALNHVLETTDCDLYWLVLPESDFVQHVMWHAWDPGHPYHDQGRDHRGLFLDIWRRIDGHVAQVMERVSDQDTVFMVSDHGAGPFHKIFKINRWLEKRGHLRFQRSPKALARRLMDGSVARASSLVSRALNKFSGQVQCCVDLEHSTFVGLEHSGFGGVYLTDRTLTGQKRRDLLTNLKAELETFVHEQPELSSIEIHIAEDLFSGGKLRDLPDLVFIIDDMETNVVAGHVGDPEITDSRRLPLDNRTGDHRMNGIFIASGAGVNAMAGISEMSIYDFAPTILHGLGLPVPDSFEGTPHPGLFMREAGRQEQASQVLDQTVDQGIDEDEQASIAEQLQSLGYME